MGNINNRTFNEKYPGKRVELVKFLRVELKRLKKLGWPEYDISNIASMFVKHIINILEENEIKITWQEHTKKLIDILYQWKGHLTIDQIIEKQKEILRAG